MHPESVRSEGTSTPQMFDVPRNIFTSKPDPFGLDPDTHRAPFYTKITMRLATAFQWDGDHVPVGIDVLTNITATAGSRQIKRTTFQQFGIFENQFNILPPLGTLFRTCHGLDQISRLEANAHVVAIKFDIRNSGAWQLYTGQIHYENLKKVFIELFIILALVALVIALLKPWKW